MWGGWLGKEGGDRERQREVGKKESEGVKLVDELVRVAVEPALGRHGSLVEVAALVATLARLHKHDSPLKALAVRAGESHGGSAGAAR